ncbi:MAG: glycosyltransferase family 39 protein [Armatimonadota bacterium]
MALGRGQGGWVEVLGLATYLASALSLAFLVPGGTSPDELGHVTYVLALASGQGLPLPGQQTHLRVAGGEQRYVSAQSHHPPVYYALLVPVSLALGNQPGLVCGVARLLGVVFGLGAILLARAAARIVLPEHASAIALGVLLSSTFVTYQIVMASANNETLAVLLVALAIYCAARLIASPSVSPRQCFLMGLLLGLAVDAKLTAAVAVVPVTAVLVAAHHAERSCRRTAGLALAALVGATLVAAPWYVPYALQSGSVAFNTAFRPAFTTPWGILAMPGDSAAVVIAIAEELVCGLWWPNWLLRDWPSSLYSWLLGGADLSGYGGQVAAELAQIAALVAGGLGVLAFMRGLDRSAEGDARKRIFLRALAWLLPVVFVGVVWQALLVDVWVARWAARYTPVALPALGILLGVGYARLLPARYARAGALAIALASVAVNCLALHRLALR